MGPNLQTICGTSPTVSLHSADFPPGSDAQGAGLYKTVKTDLGSVEPFFLGVEREDAYNLQGAGLLLQFSKLVRGWE